MAKQTASPLPLPKNWPQKVRSAAVHAIALARLALTTARGHAGDARNDSARIERLSEELLLIKEEMRIKDARMASIPAQRRPHYLPTERLAILELRAAREWSQAQTADHMLVYWSTDCLVQPMVEMTQISDFTFGGPVHRIGFFVGTALARPTWIVPRT